MGCTIEVLIRKEKGPYKPEKGDVVLAGYTGWLYDQSKPGNKGKE